jgi:hypothetical protein
MTLAIGSAQQSVQLSHLLTLTFFLLLLKFITEADYSINVLLNIVQNANTFTTKTTAPVLGI